MTTPTPESVSRSRLVASIPLILFLEGPWVCYQDSSGRLRALSQPGERGRRPSRGVPALAATGRHLDARHPMVQARVLEETGLGLARLTAAIPLVTDRLSAHRG